MKNSVAEPNPFGRTNETEIKALEKRCGYDLPSDYRDYLISSNGGKFERYVFAMPTEPDDLLDVRYFFSVNSGPPYRNLKNLWNFAESNDLREFGSSLKHLLHIGSATGSMPILLNLATSEIQLYEPDHSEVYSAEEVLQFICTLAPTFSSFVEMLASE